MFIGISAYYHDSSVSLIDENCDLIDFKKEEWLSRVKGDNSFPRLSLQEIINNHNLSFENVNCICFYEKPLRSWLTVLKHSIKNNKISNELTRNYFKNIWKSSVIFGYDLSKFKTLKNVPVIYSEHHMSHTLSALYYYNGPCVSLVVDGYGDKYCTSIHHVMPNNVIKELWTSEYPNSIGLFYSAITDFLGFAVNEGEYKVMGFASFGEPVFYDKLKETIKFENNELKLNTDFYDFVRSTRNSYSNALTDIFKIGPRESHIPLEIGDKNFKIYANIAASAQKVTEDILISLCRYANKISGEKRFLLSGGVAMNSTAVGKLSKLDCIDEINIPPSPGDSGASIGAAYFAYINKNKTTHSAIKIKKKLFPGFSHSKDDFYINVMDKIADQDNLLFEAAKILENNQILATCYENIETGPRALGNRSLICNAHNENLVKELSVKIKNRSPFRPTAPAVLEEDAHKYFELEKSIFNGYYHMAATTKVKEKYKKDIQGVVHVDNTSRIQICTENQLLGRLLKLLRKKNIFVLANTSFNFSSDPMVYDKEDAFLAVKRMNIKFLLTETGIYKLK